MKKRNVFLAILALITLLVIWVIEPITFNPFKQIKIPPAISESHLNCETPDFALKNDLEFNADRMINEHLSSNHFLGVSTGLYIQNCGTYLSSAGFMNKYEQKRATNEMLTRIASITKPMTAVAIMQLFEKGLIDLDAPIQTYIEDFPVKEKGVISTRQLLKHTSGIPHYASKWEAMSFKNYASLDEALNAIKNKKLEFKPGSQYLYSSYGYTILGVLIERVSGLSYGAYMKQNIWDKAEMTDTSLEERQNYPYKSRLYLKLGATYTKSPKTDLSIIYPAGGVQSTAKDVLKFGEAILNNTLISSESLTMMISATDELAPEKGDDPYGLGWSVYDDPKYGKIIQHGGTQPGTSGFLAIYLDQKVVSVVLSNSFGTRQNAFNLSRGLADLVLNN